MRWQVGLVNMIRQNRPEGVNQKLIFLSAFTMSRTMKNERILWSWPFWVYWFLHKYKTIKEAKLRRIMQSQAHLTVLALVEARALNFFSNAVPFLFGMILCYIYLYSSFRSVDMYGVLWGWQCIGHHAAKKENIDWGGNCDDIKWHSERPRIFTFTKENS